MNNSAGTPSQTVGPFFAVLLPLAPAAAAGDGRAVRVAGRMFDGAGEPVTDALVEAWGPPAEGATAGTFVRTFTDGQGRFEIVTARPGRLPGWDERLQAPHLALSIFARGLLKRLVTRVYFADDEAANAADPLLASIAEGAVRGTLTAGCEETGQYRFDIHLQGARETAFLAI